MDDYISRKAAIEAVCRRCKYAFPEDEPCGDCLAKAAIMAVPSADVAEVRRGRWEWYSHSYYCGFFDADGEPVYRDGVVYYCSNPKCRRKTVIKENFCPSCGTKMDLEDDNGT